MSVATASAPANIAFIKYWGVRDLDRVIPTNPSISMTLSECRSTTTVAFDHGSTEPDRLRVFDPQGEQPVSDGFRRGVDRHLARLRAHWGVTGRFTVSTLNNFPAAAGLASSASGFSALAVATSRALGLEPSPGELSDLARLSGSGSAARSVLGGFVEWPGPSGGGPAETLAASDHWDLADVIALVETAGKEVSSRDGHRRAATSPHFERRLELLPQRLSVVREAIAERSLEQLGPVLEEEAIELHLIAMSSQPPIFYWRPGTLEVLAALRALRRNGLQAYATMDAGANVHAICHQDDEAELAARLAELPSVRQVLRDRVGSGPRFHAEPVA